MRSGGNRSLRLSRRSVGGRFQRDRDSQRIRLSQKRHRTSALAAAGEVSVGGRARRGGKAAIRITRQHFGVEAVVSRLDLLSSHAKGDEPIQLVVCRAG
jgi:hypothetical protein